MSTWEAVTEAVMDGRMPPQTVLDCLPTGDGMAVLTYELELAPGENWELTLAFPSALGSGRVMLKR